MSGDEDEESEEYGLVCHEGTFEFNKGDTERLRRFVSEIEKSKTQDEANRLFGELLNEGFNEEELDDVWGNCVDWSKVVWEDEFEEETEGEVVYEELESFFGKLKSPCILAGREVALKPRKLSMVGSSLCCGLPRALSSVFPTGSSVLCVFVEKEHLLLFVGEGSFLSDGSKDVVRGLWKDKSKACFRKVSHMGKYPALSIPKQFLPYFKAGGKVFPVWSSGCCVLWFKSNLSVEELKRFDVNSSEVRSFIEKSDVKGVVEPESKVCQVCGRTKKVYLVFHGGDRFLVCDSCLRNLNFEREVKPYGLAEAVADWISEKVFHKKREEESVI